VRAVIGHSRLPILLTARSVTDSMPALFHGDRMTGVTIDIDDGCKRFALSNQKSISAALASPCGFAVKADREWCPTERSCVAFQHGVKR
jgi:hypothetical protein